MRFNAELMPRRRRGGMGWETKQSDSEAEARGKKRPSRARIWSLAISGRLRAWVGHASACQASVARPVRAALGLAGWRPPHPGRVPKRTLLGEGGGEAWRAGGGASAVAP